MKTDDLIRALSGDLAVQPPVTAGLWLRLGAALAVCVVLVGVVLGYRGDLGASLLMPLSALRFVLTFALFGVALHLALLLTRPEVDSRLPLGPLVALAGVAGVAVIWALITTPVDGWRMAAVGKTAVGCMTSIPVLSIAPVTVLLLTLRRGATSRPGLLGAFAGLAGGGLAAAAYALHCTEDSPLFYVGWYGAAIAIVTVVSSVIGSRVLRW